MFSDLYPRYKIIFFGLISLTILVIADYFNILPNGLIYLQSSNNKYEIIIKFVKNCNKLIISRFTIFVF
jgi:hypothetical protein